MKIIEKFKRWNKKRKMDNEIREINTYYDLLSDFIEWDFNQCVSMLEKQESDIENVKRKYANN